MTSENNEVRCLGIRPAHNTDDFPVTQADKDLLKMTIHLMAYHLPTITWKEVLCDINGKLIIDPVSIRAVHSPVSINPSNFIPYLDTYDWDIQVGYVANRITITDQYYMAPFNLPPGVTVTRITLYGYRDDAAATLTIWIRRITRINTLANMAVISADWADGYGSVYTETIAMPVIDNVNYSYGIMLLVSPNDAVSDIKLTGVKFDFTG